MQNPIVQKFIRWIVPLAALAAFAGWMYIAPPGILGKADAIGYAVCHRIDERSFQIGDRQLPLCARCSGTFSAAAVGLIFFAATSRQKSGMPEKKFFLPFALFFLAFAIDGSNSYLYLLKQTTGELTQIPNLYVPNNTLRLLTGSGMGLTMATFLIPAFNQTVWRETNHAPALGTWKQFLSLFGIMFALDLLILTESPIVLYPIALFSALGVLALLTMIFSIVWMMVMRQENAFEHFRQLWLPLLAGLTLALLMILGIDLFRLQLTGTWGGFPL
ncbi:MAG: DUF2085 domain-containing protein [Anaerolineales bacterium]|nr:DUF2085 domain-containing protein [Anaerolineales bacterium]